MKILHVITTINLGGAENHLFDLVSGQVQAGHRVRVAYLKGDHYWAKAYRAIGVETFCLDITNYALLFKFYKLKNLIGRFQPHIVHAHMPPAELAVRLALVGSPKLTLIISKHNDEPFAPAFKNNILAPWCARRAQAIIFISQAVRSYMLEWLPKTQGQKTPTIFYAVDKEKFRNAKPAPDIRALGSMIIGTVARLTAQKSLDTLLNAFASFLKKGPRAVLVIVGSGELEAALKKQAADLGIADKVIWTGKRQDIPSVMKAFDIFALTSVYEGFGLVLLEAMAAHVPIVASRVSAIPEVLENGKCGLLFEKRNALELEQCFESLLDKSVRSSLVEAGARRISEVFSVERMVKETTYLYSEIAD